MAVVELGTWNVRAGYVGDTHCTHSLRALQCINYPAITDVTSMLLTTASSYSCHSMKNKQWNDALIIHSSEKDEQSSTESEIHKVCAAEYKNAHVAHMTSREQRGKESSDINISNRHDHALCKELLSLWSLPSYYSNKDAHHAYLRRLYREVLRCAPTDPLLLVVPEEWWQTAHHNALASLCESVLETCDDNDEEPHNGNKSNRFAAEHNIPAVYCVRPSVCWAFASGLTSAVVLDVGHSHSTVAAVLDGYTLVHSVQSSPIAGRAVTCAMQSLLPAETLSSLTKNYIHVPPFHNLSFHYREDKEEVMEVMSSVAHIYGYVQDSSDNKKKLRESVKDEEKETFELPLTNGVYMMPDGHMLTLSDHVRCAPYELLFYKRGNNLDENNRSSARAGDRTFSNTVNVAEMMALCKAQMDVEWQLHGIHHLLAGGCGCSSANFYHRLVDELKVIDSAYYRYDRDGFMHSARSEAAAWVGASMVAESSALEPLWITKSEYDECGDEVLYRKLFL